MNRKILHRSVLLLSCLSLLSMLSITTRSETLEAHTHGVAKLTLALENNTLEIQLESPAANLVGFEHKAKSPQEREAVSQAKIILSQPENFLLFEDTLCTLKDKAIEISGIMDSHSHIDHKSHEKHRENDDHEHTEHYNHRDISAYYRFSCINAKTLEFVSVPIFENFPGIEKINVMWVTNINQGMTTLTSTQQTISLK